MCFNLLFTSCARLATDEAVQVGRKMFSQLPKVHYKNEFVMTSLLDMFVKCGDIVNAEKVFAQMTRNVVDYGQMMKYFNEKEMPMKTLTLYEQMKRDGVKADLVTYLLVIDACSAIGIQSTCRSIVEQIPQTMTKNIICQTSLIDMWVG